MVNPAAELVDAVPFEQAPALLAAFIAGSLCPTYYAQEWLRGFGRAMVARLPYQPPPTMSEEEALQAAAETAESEVNLERDAET